MFKARHLESLTLDYGTHVNGDLGTAADKVDLWITAYKDDTTGAYSNDPSLNFIIAHSQGVLVTRELVHTDVEFMQQYQSSTPHVHGYGGFITVGSPLQGAQILNNMDLIEAMATEACSELAAGPASEPILNFRNGVRLDLLSIIGRALIINDADACDFVGNTLVPFLFKDNTSPITNDYLVNAPAISTYNNDVNNPYYVDMPKVAFYGVEPEQNIFLRTARWIVDGPQHEAHWQANDDSKFLIEEFLPLYFDYLSNKITNNIQHNHHANMSQWTFMIPPLSIHHIIQSTKHWQRTLAWNRGVTFLNQINEKWAACIGAREVQFNGSSSNPMFTTTLKESDGVVLTESAMNLPGATHSPVKLKGRFIEGEGWTGSSHMQMRNDAALKKKLIRLYDGAYGMFFFTEIKQ